MLDHGAASRIEIVIYKTWYGHPHYRNLMKFSAYPRSFVTRVLPSDRSPLAGLGCGLPLSRLYAEYMGGRIKLQTMPRCL